MRSANIQLYFPESKWSGLQHRRALLRSIIGHCLFATTVSLVAATAQVPVLEEHPEIYVDVLLDSGARAPSDFIERIGKRGVNVSKAQTEEGLPTKHSAAAAVTKVALTKIRPLMPRSNRRLSTDADRGNWKWRHSSFR